MNKILAGLRAKPLLWLLAAVPAVLIGERLAPESHTMLFVLAVLAIIPLAALLSHATESVAAKTGDAVGGLLNATLGNLTELVIAITALRAGMFDLVKASVAGAIVTNSLFMLGMAFLLGGLKHRVQEYNAGTARLQAGMLFLAAVALTSLQELGSTERQKIDAAADHGIDAFIFDWYYYNDGLFLQRGFVRVTADDIAAELGISKATLYREFRSKEDILRAVVRDDRFNLLESLAATIADIQRGLQKILGDVRFTREQSSRPRPALDISRARSELGYVPKFDVEAGLKDFIMELRRN